MQLWYQKIKGETLEMAEDANKPSFPEPHFHDGNHICNFNLGTQDLLTPPKRKKKKAEQKCCQRKTTTALAIFKQSSPRALLKFYIWAKVSGRGHIQTSLVLAKISWSLC